MRTRHEGHTPASDIPSDRRTHNRLRDLCDEVLASFRLASRGDLFSEQDRAEARALMTQVASSRA